MARKRPIWRPLLLLMIAWAGLFFLWNSVEMGINPEMNVSIDLSKIGGAILGKVVDVFRDFIAPR